MNTHQSPTNPHAAGKAAHTPTPWFTNENGLARNRAGETQWTIGPTAHCIATVHRRTDDGAQMEADAKFIVRACNSHAALLEALQSILFQAGCREARDLGNLNYDRLHAVEAQARAAIARATGQGGGE